MTDAARRRRLLVTLCGVLVVDALLVGLVAALLAPWVDAALSTAGVDAPAPVRGLLVAVPALALFLRAQLRYTRQETLAAVDATPVDEGSHPDLVSRVERLAALADVEPPGVAIADAPHPNSLTVGRPGDATVVVSQGLLDAVEGDRLDAVLAHELAHLKNRDVTVMTLASFLPSVLDDDRSLTRALLPGGGTAALVAVLAAAYLLSGPVLPGPLFTPGHLVAFAVTLGVLVVVGGVGLGLVAAAMLWLSHRLSRDRELAADRAAAQLTGDPATLATTLQTLSPDAPERPATDARVADSRQGLCFLPHGFDDQRDGGDGGFSVRTRSHPTVGERVERLQDLAAELERS